MNLPMQRFSFQIMIRLKNSQLNLKSLLNLMKNKIHNGKASFIICNINPLFN